MYRLLLGMMSCGLRFYVLCAHNGVHHIVSGVCTTYVYVCLLLTYYTIQVLYGTSAGILVLYSIEKVGHTTNK